MQTKSKYFGPFTADFTLSTPILFLNIHLDPATLMKNAYRMAGIYRNRSVIELDAKGHCAPTQLSECARQLTKQHFATSAIPLDRIVCSLDSGAGKPMDQHAKFYLEALMFCIVDAR